MDRKQFFLTVVPWEGDGYLRIQWQLPVVDKKNPPPFHGRSFVNLDSALKFIDEIQDQGFNIWFCVSRQKERGERDKRLATYIQVGFFDVDKYETKEEALAEIMFFCIKFDIPKPSLVVDSGGGFHVYWLSDRLFSKEDWQPFANALKNAAKSYGLKADLGVTVDVVRVLRVPGTWNVKPDYDEPRQVKVLLRYSTLVKHDFQTVFAPLLELAPAQKAKKPKPNLGKLADAFKDAPIQEVEEYEPLDFPPIKQQCAWLREAHDTGGKDFKEPLWNLTTYCAIFLKDGYNLAHEFAKGHPQYSVDTTDKKWEDKLRAHKEKPELGWPKCETINTNGSKHCAGCPHFKTHVIAGLSPLHLGIRPKPKIGDPENEEAENQEIKALGGHRPPSLRLPQSFAVNEKGQICALVAGRTVGRGKSKIVEPNSLVPVILREIRNPSLQYQNGFYGIGFQVKADVGTPWRDVFLSSTDTQSASVLIKHLHSRCVLTNQEKGCGELALHFAVSWLDKLMNEDTAVRDSGTMGWRFNDDGKRMGFVYNDILFRENGDNIPLLVSSEDEFRKWYKPKGTKDAWLQASKLLTDRKRPELDLIIATAFAAPLTTFTGNLYSALVSIWGPPGTAKSTAQQVGAAVWGHPKQTRESLNSTSKSVQKRMGLTQNLPAWWDDLQDERHLETLFNAMFVASGGSEGGRLNIDTSMRERLEWQTLMIACANASFVEFLAKKQKSTTAGIRRVFEIEFKRKHDEPGLIDSFDANQIFGRLVHNYGVIGQEYAQLLARNHKEIEGLVVKTTKRFKDTVKGTADESFWWGLCGLLLTGATLARQIGAEIDVEGMERFLYMKFYENRTTRDDEVVDASAMAHTEAALVAFINEFASKHAMYVSRLFKHNRIPIEVISHTPNNENILIVVARDDRRVVISKKAFKDYLNKQDIHTRQVLQGLVTHFGAEEVRVCLGAGTANAQAQELCFNIPVHPGVIDHALYEFLAARGAPGPTIVKKS